MFLLKTATRRNIFPLIILIGFLSTCKISFAQPADLDPKKWAGELSKKDRSSYDSLRSLVVKMQEVDSLPAFQFLDQLSEKGRSKGDHFQAFFNCLKVSVIYNKYYYDFQRVGKTPGNIDWIRQQIMNLYTSAIEIAYRSEDEMLVAHVSYAYGSVIYSLSQCIVRDTPSVNVKSCCPALSITIIL